MTAKLKVLLAARTYRIHMITKVSGDAGIRSSKAIWGSYFCDKSKYTLALDVKMVDATHCGL